MRPFLVALLASLLAVPLCGQARVTQRDSAAAAATGNRCNGHASLRVDNSTVAKGTAEERLAAQAITFLRNQRDRANRDGGQVADVFFGDRTGGRQGIIREVTETYFQLEATGLDIRVSYCIPVVELRTWRFVRGGPASQLPTLALEPPISYVDKP